MPEPLVGRSRSPAVPTDERFLVTGSEGCIGSWVVRTLAAQGVPVVAADLSTEGTRLRRILDAGDLGKVVFKQCDIAAPEGVSRLVAEEGVTRIVHLAALQIPFVAADPVRGAEVNVLGTVRVLEAARRHAGQVRGLSYASSGAVFGTRNPHLPDTLYGALKVCNEACARFYASDYATPTVGLRPCVVYGPNRDQGLTSAVTTAIKAAALGVPYRIPFGGALDLQYAEDVAWAFILAALSPAQVARVYDLHGDLVEVRDMVEMLERLRPEATGLITWDDEPIPGRVEYDDAELQAFVGELPKTPLDRGVAATLEVFVGQSGNGQLVAAGL